MTTVFALFLVQILVGAVDNFWHHELTEKLPSKPQARHELALHAAREGIYGVIFFGIAWWQWHGAWALVLGGLFAVEIAVTLADFVVEDRIRKLPAFERVLHTLLALNMGAVLMALVPVLRDWWAAPGGFAAADYGIMSWVLTACAAGVSNAASGGTATVCRRR